MATTSPDNIRSPNDGDQYAIVQDMGAMADSVQTALNNRANMYKGSAAQRAAFTTAAEGTHWQDTDGAKHEWVRKGGAWRGARPIGGAVSMNQSNASTPARSTVTFPTGYFATTPAVSVSCQTGAPQNLQVSYGSPSATSVDIYGWRGNTNGIDAMWVAVPTS